MVQEMGDPTDQKTCVTGMMNIGINAVYLEKKRTGIARYLLNMLDHWSVDHPDNRYYLYFSGEVPGDAVLKRACFIKKKMNVPRLLDKWIFWENIILPLQILRWAMPYQV